MEKVSKRFIQQFTVDQLVEHADSALEHANWLLHVMSGNSMEQVLEMEKDRFDGAACMAADPTNSAALICAHLFSVRVGERVCCERNASRRTVVSCGWWRAVIIEPSRTVRPLSARPSVRPTVFVRPLLMLVVRMFPCPTLVHFGCGYATLSDPY